MRVVVNGEERELPEGLDVAGLLALLELGQRRVAVEVNRALVRRDEHGRCVLRDGDRVEIVTLVGGG